LSERLNFVKFVIRYSISSWHFLAFLFLVNIITFTWYGLFCS
jgi:hypothetical protein